MRSRAALLAFVPVLVVSCGSSERPSPPVAGVGSITIGLQADQVQGFVDDVEVRVEADDHSIVARSFDLRAYPNALPASILVVPPSPATTAHVSVVGYARGNATDAGLGTPVLTRTATVPFVLEGASLLRIKLETGCVGAPACPAGQTCIAARCQSDVVPKELLEPYTQDWALDGPDVCKPADHGAPEVILGTGQLDFAPITAGQTLTAERGPQGGHHLWVAARVRNLKRSGSTTTIRGRQPDTGVEIPPTAFVFTFDPDEGGYCKLYGLRYQLDNGGIDYKQFLGKPLDLTVTVHDPAGAEASGTAHVIVDAHVIGE